MDAVGELGRRLGDRARGRERDGDLVQAVLAQRDRLGGDHRGDPRAQLGGQLQRRRRRGPGRRPRTPGTAARSAPARPSAGTCSTLLVGTRERASKCSSSVAAARRISSVTSRTTNGRPARCAASTSGGAVTGARPSTSSASSAGAAATASYRPSSRRSQTLDRSQSRPTVRAATAVSRSSTVPGPASALLAAASSSRRLLPPSLGGDVDQHRVQRQRLGRRRRRRRGRDGAPTAAGRPPSGCGRSARSPLGPRRRR